MTLLATIKSRLTDIGSAIVDAFATMRHSKPLLGPASTPHINTLLLNLCNGDHERALWVLRWLAYPIRHEGTKMATSLLVAGAAGSGKSLFFDQIIAPMYGARAAFPRNQIGDNFNTWMSGKFFVLADEYNSTSINVAQLKNMLTSTTIRIHSKGSQDRLERNKMNFVFMSSERNALKSESNDRRFMVLEPSNRLSPSAYAAVAGEISEGGVEAFYEFLKYELDLHGFSPNTAPAKIKSDAKEAA